MKRVVVPSTYAAFCCLLLIQPAFGQSQTQTTNGPDVIVSAVGAGSNDLGNYGTINTNGVDVTGYALGSISCNIGNQNAIWTDSAPNANQHPVIGQNLYRHMQVNGAYRFEQIGIGWLKHGFCAADAGGGGCNVIGHPCSPDGSCDILTIGCSDTYGQGLNGNQQDLGPRSEVNPTTGAYPYPYILNWNQTGNAIFKRMRVRVSDINTNITPAPRYFGEVQYINTDEQMGGTGFNNVSYREVIRGALSGGGYNLSFSGGTIQMVPAITAWAAIESGVTIIPIQTQEANTNIAPFGGRIYVAYKVYDLSGNGGGPFRYEYAVYNMNSDRSIRAFSIPLIGNALTNIGYYGPKHHSGEPYSTADWNTNASPTAMTWSCETFNTNANANALRWGVTFNFRFDTAQPPTNGDATLTYFKPVTGAPNTITVAVKVPASADCNTNSTQDQTDIANLVSKDCNTNLIPDECEPDCNSNGTADRCDIASGAAFDCNTDFIPDVCNSTTNLLDRNSNGVPDICDDCNSNGTFDAVEVGLPDCNTNGLPDTCDANFGMAGDCNTNLVIDNCEPDCNTNLTADSCEILGGLPDTDGDSVPDVCDNCDNLSNVDQAPWLNRIVQANNSGQHTSIAVAPDGHIGVAYYRVTGSGLGVLRCWDDSDKDLVPESGEMLTVDATTNVGQFTSIGFDSVSRAAVAYHDVTNRDLKLWFDANKNSVAEPAELHLIDTMDNTGQTTSLRYDPQGRVTVSFFRVTNNALKLWHDANGNYEVDSGEMVVIDGLDASVPGGVNAGQYGSLRFDSAGRAVISYYQTLSGSRWLKLWVDLNTNYAPDAGEIRVIDNSADVGQYSSLAFNAAGKAGVAYFNNTTPALKYWYDADGDYAFDTGEVVTIDSTNGAGPYASLAFDASGNALVAYYRTASQVLRFWRDSNGNSAFDTGEASNIRTGADVGSYASMVFHPAHYAPMVAYRDNTNQNLGFTCQLDWDDDGFCFTNDNCPGVSNVSQADGNNNGIGDACEITFVCGDRNPGDMDGNGSVNAADMSPFVSVLLNPAAHSSTQRCAADLNQDSQNDGADVSLFVNMLIP